MLFFSRPQLLHCPVPITCAFCVPAYNALTAICSSSSDLTGFYKSPRWRDGLHLWDKGQVNFDTALTDFNTRQFKTWMKTTAAQVNFCLFLNVFPVWLAIRCLKIGTYVLIKVLLTYLFFTLLGLYTETQWMRTLFSMHTFRPPFFSDFLTFYNGWSRIRVLVNNYKANNKLSNHPITHTLFKKPQPCVWSLCDCQWAYCCLYYWTDGD